MTTSLLVALEAIRAAVAQEDADDERRAWDLTVDLELRQADATAAWATDALAALGAPKSKRPSPASASSAPSPAASHRRPLTSHRALSGAVHYWGLPGGPAGVLAAGFLGWLLAKSIGETGGLGWAWFLHFLQDVVILSALFAAAP